MNKNKILGVFGGMGPEAGINFCNNLIRNNTLCKKDQDHIQFILFNLPKIPNRIEAIINNDSNDLFFEFKKIIEKMELCDVSEIVMMCNTVHYFINDVRGMSNIPIIDMVEVMCKYIKKNRIKKVGLLATNITIEKNIYSQHIDTIIPDSVYQDMVMEAILCVKGNKHNRAREMFSVAIDHLKEKGAKVIIMGCTEIPLVVKKTDTILDPSDILSKEIINEYSNSKWA